MMANFTEAINAINHITEVWESKLLNLPDDTISNRRNSQNRTIKQLIGHLIDSASNNHQRMVRLQYHSDLTFPDYTQDNDRWIAIQNYQNEDWNNLVALWKFYNLHIVHLVQNIDISKLNNTWTDFEGNIVSLHDMINGYPSHLHLHISEIEEIIAK
jgi:hypothetical protein